MSKPTLQKIETINAITGRATIHEVHPDRAFEFLNLQRRQSYIKSARIVVA